MNEEIRTRGEHLAWCKRRALERLSADPEEAWASFWNDLDQHPETAGLGLTAKSIVMLMIGPLSTPEKMRRFIEGFH